MDFWAPGLTLADIEKKAILKALRVFGGNRTQTAAALGISTRTLYTKLEEYEPKVKGEEKPNAPERMPQEANQRTKAATDAIITKISVEPAPKVSTESKVPVRKRKEMEDLLQGQDAKNDTHEGIVPEATVRG